MTTHGRHVPHWRTHREATLFGATPAVLLVLLGVVSYPAGWDVFGQGGWVWFLVCVPEALLIAGLLVSGRVDESSRRVLLPSLSLGVLGNLVAVFLLVGALLTERTAHLSGAQLLTSGAIVWLTNVIVFGLCFWTLDAGGPAQRARVGRPRRDFQFPQDDDASRAEDKWEPRFEDYLYVATTNGIAFSPTDAMPLTLSAKRLMALESLISVAAVLVIAARAVNVIGS